MAARIAAPEGTRWAKIGHYASGYHLQRKDRLTRLTLCGRLVSRSLKSESPHLLSLLGTCLVCTERGAKLIPTYISGGA